ncbi:hypothetical protein G7Y79_00006g018410 [Physcia stellaris]|nr:hypothetical protein G7Y79_00006g018410 [Physcia stellaris]
MTSSSPPPFPLHELCTRAITDPTSITPAERNLIQARPDPETENSLYLTKISLPLSDLIAKALTDPPTLSTEEAHILVHGPEDRTSPEKAARREQYDALTDEQRALWKQLVKEEQPRLHPSQAAMEAFSKPQVPIRPDENSSFFHGSVLTGTPLRLSDPRAHPGGGFPVSETFEIHYIEDEEYLANAEQAGLLAYYARLIEEGRLKEGFSWDVFMTADDNVLEIFGEVNRELVVPVWDAGWKAGEVGEHGWRGALAFRAEMVFGLLIPKLVRGDPNPLEDLAMMAQDR